jgi:hypothetical protein
MKLLRTFPKDAFEFGLASWQWLGLREQTPRFATCFGDIFLESLDGWWFLDTVEGTLELRWTSAVTMYAELESAEGRATYLMDDLVRDARSRGIHLGEEDVYVFNPHPALGGELGVNSLGTMRFELAVNWVGQMHDQVLHGTGEIHLPPMPDEGRHPGAPRVTAAWDAAWSDDETFDVPFEQYLATTTFAAVATPRRSDGARHHAAQGYGAHSYGAPDHGAQDHDVQGYGTQTYEGESYEAPANPEQPVPTPPWPGQSGSASLWSGQAEAVAQEWPEPSRPAQLAAPMEGYGTAHPAVGQYGAGQAAQQTGGSNAPQDWYPYGTDQATDDQADTAWTDDSHANAGGAEADQDQYGQAGPAWSSPVWSNPTWASPTWGGQAPAVAAGGSPQQTPSDDPFTAWDDLWGKR